MIGDYELDVSGEVMLRHNNSRNTWSFQENVGVRKVGSTGGWIRFCPLLLREEVCLLKWKPLK